MNLEREIRKIDKYLGIIRKIDTAVYVEKVRLMNVYLVP